MESPVPEYPPIFPQLRRRVIIEDFDFGDVKHEIELHRTGRIDCYDMHVDGKLYKKRIGWSRVLEIIRKQFLRVSAEIS